MKKVKFNKNGYVTVMNDDIAKVYSDKKKVKILGEAKEPEREKKEDPKKGK